MILDLATQPSGNEWVFMTPAVIFLIVFAVLCIAIPFHVRVIRKESEKTNKLLRQMIRSSGHEPEA